jgi:hypothetical protein
MKQTLLLTLFILCGLTAFSQNRYTNSAHLSQANDRSLDIKVFPNPATDYIGITNSQKVQQIRIYNLVGRQMKDFEAVQGEKYYVGDLPRGMYLVQLIDANKRVIITRRVNKQ